MRDGCHTSDAVVLPPEVQQLAEVAQHPAWDRVAVLGEGLRVAPSRAERAERRPEAPRARGVDQHDERRVDHAHVLLVQELHSDCAHEVLEHLDVVRLHKGAQKAPDLRRGGPLSPEELQRQRHAAHEHVAVHQVRHEHLGEALEAAREHRVQRLKRPRVELDELAQEVEGDLEGAGALGAVPEDLLDEVL